MEVDYILESEDTLPIPEEVRVVATPGHTPGSICLYVTSQKVLVVGDALRYTFGRLRLPAPSVTQDPWQARESLKKLTALDFEVLCFSHYPPLREKAEQALHQLIDRTSLSSSIKRR